MQLLALARKYRELIPQRKLCVPQRRRQAFGGRWIAIGIALLRENLAVYSLQRNLYVPITGITFFDKFSNLNFK